MTDTLGQVLRKLRKSRRMTQVAVGAHVGVSDTMVSIWENDQGAPTLAQLKMLARLLPRTPEERTALLAAAVEHGEEFGPGAVGGGTPIGGFPVAERSAELAPVGAALGAAPQGRDDRVAEYELAPAGFVTRAEFDNLRQIMERVARKIGVLVVAAICVIFGGGPASASETEGSRVRDNQAFNVPSRNLRRKVSQARRLWMACQTLVLRHVFHLRLVTYGTPTWAA